MEHKWLCFLTVSLMFFHNISVYTFSVTESHKHIYILLCIHKERLCLNPNARTHCQCVCVMFGWPGADSLLQSVSWSGPLRPVHFSSPPWEAKLESDFSLQAKCEPDCRVVCDRGHKHTLMGLGSFHRHVHTQL